MTNHSNRQVSNLRNILAIISVLVSSIALFTGCTGDESSAFSNIPSYGWVYGDTIYFTPGENGVHRSADDDTTRMVTGDISVAVRHNNNYEYSNLWLELRYQQADSIVTDTLNIVLADDFGNWLGRGSGISYQLEQKVLDHVNISTATPIKLSHIMRADTLPDIEQIGVIMHSVQQ